MNMIKFSLSTQYDFAPSQLKIECLGETIFEGELTKNLVIEHETDRADPFEIKITKTGKIKKIVDMNGKQEVVIESINLNGIYLKNKEFGRFLLKNNPYLSDEVLQTNILTLNGEWTIKLPRLNLVGDISTVAGTKTRDQFAKNEISCFGCSQTYGAFIEHDETWPSQLARRTGKLVKNYGVRGSNINEITAMVEDYLKKFKTDIILLYLPHTFRRQIRKDNEILNIISQDRANKDLLLHGEEHSIAMLAGSFKAWLEDISKHTKIYFGTYHASEDELYRKTPLEKFMFPFLNNDDYPKASDGNHAGPEFNRAFAKMLVDFLNLG